MNKQVGWIQRKGEKINYICVLLLVNIYTVNLHQNKKNQIPRNTSNESFDDFYVGSHLTLLRERRHTWKNMSCL